MEVKYNINALFNEIEIDEKFNNTEKMDASQGEINKLIVGKLFLEKHNAT